MLNVIAILFVIFGLIGLLTIALKHLQNKNHLATDSKLNIIVEQPIKIDNKRSILNVTSNGNHYVILLGPHNDILLESHPSMPILETVSFEARDIDFKSVSKNLNECH